MGFPQSFIDDLRMQADIVQVVQEYVSLRKSGATYKGLCPFHSEKTPSFHVNRDKGFFHCFGCGVGGDVFKFLELQEKLGFVDAVRHLASKFGMPIPEQVGGRDAHADAAEREALLKVHERAAEYFQAQLAAPAGRKAQRMLHDRGITADTIKRLGLGYAPPAYEGLKTALVKEGLPLPLLVRSGLAVERDNGQTVDRFRGRLMIPIARDCRLDRGVRRPRDGEGPAAEIPELARNVDLHEGPDAVRPESHQRRTSAGSVTPSWSKAISISRSWCRPGITPVVASSGTALTPAQAQLLRRFTSKVILSFDPDAAGQGAAARSCELLVAEGFEVNVAVLPPGEDPDSVVQKRGRDAYLELLKTLAALSRISAGSRGRRARSEQRRGTAPVPDGDAGRGGPNSRSGGARPVRGSSGAQGAYYRRGGARRGPKGGRPEAAGADRARAAELRAGETGRKRADLGADPRARKGDDSPQRFCRIMT